MSSPSTVHLNEIVDVPEKGKNCKPLPGSRAPNNTPSVTDSPVVTADGGAVDPETDMAAVQAKLDELTVGDFEFSPAAAKVIKRRIKALVRLQEQRDELHSLYLVEREALDKKFNALYKPFYTKRTGIVTGVEDVHDSESEAGEGEETEAGNEDEELPLGVPDFWVTVLCNNSHINEIVDEKDVIALRHLKDIRIMTPDEMQGFRLEFEFAPNAYFDNSVLSKSYYVNTQNDDGETILDRVEGTEIQWKPNMCLTERRVRKKVKDRRSGKTKVVCRVEPCSSFFNFFHEIEVPDQADDDVDENVIQQLDLDFSVGTMLHDTVIPNAIYWYTGEACDDMSDEDYIPDNVEEESEEQEASDEEEEDGTEVDDPQHPVGQPGNTAQNPPDCKNQ